MESILHLGKSTSTSSIRIAYKYLINKPFTLKKQTRLRYPWRALEKANTIEFGDMGGYVIATTIITFLVDTYGLDALKQFIIAPEKVEEIYKLCKDELEVLWLNDLSKKV